MVMHGVSGTFTRVGYRRWARRSSEWECGTRSITYRTHDSGLPVELERQETPKSVIDGPSLMSGNPTAGRFVYPAISGRRQRQGKAKGKGFIPDPRRRDRRSRKRAGHWGQLEGEQEDLGDDDGLTGRGQ